MDKGSEITFGTQLPSGSTFFGKYDAMGMHDFGMYVFPNGTRYLGQFVDNRFHGVGTIKIPNKVSFQVLHNHGKLEQIRKMSFSDELPIQFTLVGDTISFENWKYCSAEDRRFYGETQKPLTGVGPTKFKTANGPKAPPLKRDIFDLGFGKLNKNDWLTDVTKDCHDNANMYVNCPAVRTWIRENCRHGPLVDLQLDSEVLARNAREIINNNLKSESMFKKKIERTKIHNTRICRGSSSEESSYSAREVLQQLSTNSKSYTSELEDSIKQDPDPAHVCPPGLSLGHLMRESNVCHIN